MTPLEQIKALDDDHIGEIEVTDQENAVALLKSELLALWEAMERVHVGGFQTAEEEVAAAEACDAAVEALNTAAAEAVRALT
ncbi:hypothetical protein [Geothrix campi]|uniref:hypothetical protein n=1 Tax=Geothrix campi TaxID=2966450 RepID=UPI0021474AFF|nr:hypothetical protein [Geothrix sp. SG10]